MGYKCTFDPALRAPGVPERGSRMTRPGWLGLVACALMACQTTAPQRQVELDLTRVPLTGEGVAGLSGLTTDGNGHLWTVSERDWALVEFY